MGSWNKTHHTTRSARWLTLFSPLGIDLYLPAIPAMALIFGDHMHLSLTLYFFSLGFGQLIWGVLSDYWGRKPIALLGIALFSTASLLVPWCTTIVEFCVLRILQALGASAASLSAAAIIRDTFSGREAAREYGILGSIRNVIPILAPFIGSALLLMGNWTLCFLVLAYSGIGLWVYLWKSMSETRKVSHIPQKTRTLHPWKNRPFLGFTACCCGALSLIFSYVTLAPLELMDNGGLSTQQFGLLFGLNGLFMSLSCLYFARYAMRKGALATIWISLLFIGGGGLGLITQSYRTDVLTFMIPIFFMSTGFGGLLGPATGLAMQPFTQSIGQAASLSNAAQFFVSGIISTLIPYVPYPPRLSLGFLALVVTTGAGFICWYLITRFGAATLEGDGNEELDALKAVNTP